MSRKQQRIDTASVATVLITVVLFAIAVVEKGFTHELLLEAGVFLISGKLILASAKADLVMKNVQAQLDEIERKLEKR